MITASTILGYLLIGFAVSGEVDAQGHPRRLGDPFHWKAWAAGIIGWPVLVYLGGRR